MQSYKKDFLLIYISQAFSLVSSTITYFAILWWITYNTNSAIYLSAFVAIGYLPYVLFGAVAGGIVDKYDKKKLIIISDMLVAVFSVLLSVYFFVSVPPIMVILIVMFFRSSIGVLHSPSFHASIPALVPKEQLLKVNAVGQSLNSACYILSPMLAAILVEAVKIEYILFVDLMGGALASVILLLIKKDFNITSSQKKTENKTTLRLKEGIKVLLSNKLFLKLTLIVPTTYLFTSAACSLAPLYIKKVFSLGAYGASVASGAFSLGLLCGSLYLGVRKKMKNEVKLVPTGVLITALAILVTSLVVKSMFVVYVVMVFIMGVGSNIMHLPYTVYIQKEIEPQHLGKALSISSSILSTTTPLGIIVAGILSEIIGLRAWFFGCAIIVIVLSIFARHSLKDITSKSNAPHQ